MSTYDTAKYRLHDLLVDSVRKRLMSDRPIGCLLSGGLDSSVIAAILCELVGSDKVRTYSVGMEGGLDLRYARKVADALGTDHTEVIVTVGNALAAIPQVTYDTETYDITTIRASTMMWLLCDWISKNSDDTVIFSGEGSDELFCGYLYFHNAPSTIDASNESKRLLKNLYLYDVLRADRSVSCHGLELRVPFLDTKILEFSLSLSPVFKAPVDGWEKKILRDAFTGYIPEEVLWRRKDGLSDGCSSLDKSWGQHITEFVDTRIGDELFDDQKYISKEAMYYKLLFDKYFSTYKLKIDHWMPRWSGNLTDPSGRLIEAFDE
jgi:asparagine synthase (glutamine-hydrolysing)